jgi:transposase InsO family protein
MAFRETCVMEERISMFRDYDSGAFSVTELCARYGVSRETFYVWRARRASGEALWFEDRSHAVKRCQLLTDAAVVERIVALRHRFVHFGPKKIRARLLLEAPDVVWPAASTIGDILKREGLVTPVRRRRRAIEQDRPAVAPVTVNSEWSADFKGWFRTRDGQRIDPLTVTDNASRYLLGVEIAAPDYLGIKPAFTRFFEEFGLPEALRTDNGAPFGSLGAGGLSLFSVWLLKLGIEPRFGRPACPQDNGRHERMHKTLKAQTSSPAAATAHEQQQRFDEFRRHFNEERPHEALGQTLPAQMWSASLRAMPAKVEDPWYDANYETRRARAKGEIKWHGGYVVINEALAGEVVGITERDDGHFLVRFSHYDLGIIDAKNFFHRFSPPRAAAKNGGNKTRKVSGISPV